MFHTSFSCFQGRYLAAACSKESTRYALKSVAFQQHDGKAYALATDGRMLAAVRVTAAVTDESPAEVLAPAAIVKSADRINVNGRVEGAKGAKVVVGELGEGTFPPADQIVPKHADKVQWVGLNADLLAALAHALADGSGAVKLGFDTNEDGSIAWNRPIRVMATVGGYEAPSEAVGVLMPISIASKVEKSKVAEFVSAEWEERAKRFGEFSEAIAPALRAQREKSVAK